MKYIHFLFGIILFTSCSQEELHEINLSNEHHEKNEVIYENFLENYKIPDNDISLLQKLGFSGSNAQVYETKIGDKSTIKYLLEGDIALERELLESMLPKELLSKGGTKTFQYRTALIASPRTYYIYYYGNNGNRNSIVSRALNEAIENYNELNLSIKFSRLTTQDYPESVCLQVANIILNEQDLAPNIGARAGFPRIKFGVSGVSPAPGITLNLTNRNQHLYTVTRRIMHEIGHCIGFRHSDGVNPQQAGCTSLPDFVGPGKEFIHIPGTPRSPNGDSNSVFKSCTDNSNFTNPNFSAFDVVALQQLW